MIDLIQQGGALPIHQAFTEPKYPQDFMAQLLKIKMLVPRKEEKYQTDSSQTSTLNWEVMIFKI